MVGSFGLGLFDVCRLGVLRKEGAADQPAFGGCTEREGSSEEQTLRPTREKHSLSALLTTGIPNPHPIYLKLPLHHNWEQTRSLLLAG